MYLYLIINIAAIFIPFIASFDKRLAFAAKWKYLFPSILLSMLIFIPWDIYFTSLGVWGFNYRYLTEVYLFNLPVEEWLFFVTIPYSCIFTYEALNYLIKKDYFEKQGINISFGLAIILLTLAVFNVERMYTTVTFLLLSAFLFLQIFVLKSKWLGRFYFSYLFILIPFLIVNGILTGSFIDGEIVWYNDAENLGLKIFTIPIEDSVYGLLLIMLNVTFYEWLKNRKLAA